MREHRIRPSAKRGLVRGFERERLERYAARGCRISAYMLEHGVSFPDAIEALARQLPGPASDQAKLGRSVPDEEPA